eukprot:UC1_evm1s116
MSRVALEHRAVKDRQRAAALAAKGIVPAEPPAEGADPAGCLSYRCNRLTMDLGHVLYSNVTESSYFREKASALKTFDACVDEIYNHVDHLEPFVTRGNAPSTAFCLLYRLFCMRMTEEQMDCLVTHEDSVYIRAVGFLYLRYTAPADMMWEWFIDYIDDPTELQIARTKSIKATTIGRFLRDILKEPKYYSVRFPRIPVLKEREIKEYLRKHPYDPRRFEEGGGGGGGGEGGDADGAAASEGKSREAAAAGDHRHNGREDRDFSRDGNSGSSHNRDYDRRRREDFYGDRRRHADEHDRRDRRDYCRDDRGASGGSSSNSSYRGGGGGGGRGGDYQDRGDGGGGERWEQGRGRSRSKWGGGGERYSKEEFHNWRDDRGLRGDGQDRRRQ